MNRKNKGFTLIEMLVVIAMIAVLVSVIIPVVGNSTNRARAAADAANLHTVHSMLNAAVSQSDVDLAETVRESTVTESKFVPGAKLHVLYEYPGFVDVYYVLDDKYYSLDCLSTVAATGVVPEEAALVKPETTGTWYIAGVGLAG